MPTYQYRCTECGQDLEAVQKFSDPALTECPNCSGKLRKVFNAVGVVFKGSGFYRTDNRKPGSEDGATSSAKPSGEAKTDSGGSSDSKPAKEKVAASASTSGNGSSGGSSSGSSGGSSSGSTGGSSTGASSS